MTRLSGGFDPEDFEVDGALRDVCVLGADLPMWERLLEAVAEPPWEHRFAVDDGDQRRSRGDAGLLETVP